jgi:YfiH family protein
MVMNPSAWLRPVWHAPQQAAPHVGSLMTTRAGGVSRAPWDHLNLGTAVGDDPVSVGRNRALFRQALDGAVPVFLKQVHGARVIHLGPGDAAADAPLEEADACIATEPGLACTVQVADCLPVLFQAPQGRGVGAAHAGWRGLAGGVLEATLRALCEAAGCSAGEVQVWLGPCIGARRFEVGPEVLDACLADGHAEAAAAFIPTGRPGKWLADLPRLARGRLLRAGVSAVSGGPWCTVEDPSRFFSFRRDGVTGRMAAAIWIGGC